ncbi:hypothetical protein ACFYOA_18235 [Streptomyces iakyrus]|uniref:hypothetical protein n=1 Tax=Streptomyces iakyrus TaxID=68219 RepID=UPI0036A49D86
MGLGTAMIMPGTLSTITTTFQPEQRAKGVAMWSGFGAAGNAAGGITTAIAIGTLVFAITEGNELDVAGREAVTSGGLHLTRSPYR